MRNKFYILVLLFIAIPFNAWGITKNVTITWTMSDISNITGYRMYFSYSSTMADKQLACETGDATVTSLTCPNVDLVQSPVYFVVAAVLTDGEANSTPVSETIVTGISMVQGFQLVTNDSVTSPPAISHAVNFQPADAPIPEGYLVDAGAGFDESRGYGWVTGPSSSGTRDRDEPNSPDQAYDTMIHVAPASVWEIDLANGNYSVTICNGDASYPQGTQNVQAEGISVLDNVPLSSTTPWVVRTATIAITDGRLSITFSGSTDPARLCWLTITSIN